MKITEFGRVATITRQSIPSQLKIDGKVVDTVRCTASPFLRYAKPNLPAQPAVCDPA